MGSSRQEYWSGLPFPSPGHLPDPGIDPGSPALQADPLPSEPPYVVEHQHIYNIASQWISVKSHSSNTQWFTTSVSGYSIHHPNCLTLHSSSSHHYVKTLRASVEILPYGPPQLCQVPPWPTRLQTSFTAHLPPSSSLIYISPQSGCSSKTGHLSLIFVPP